MILFEKYGSHQPLNRQSERYAREGGRSRRVDPGRSRRCRRCRLAPLYELIRSHVLAAERLHGDDTTVPVLAKGKTITGRLWAYVRDDRPFGRAKPGRRRCSSTTPAIAAASIPSGTSPAMPGSCRPTPKRVQAALRADTRRRDRHRGLCWAHAGGKFFELADIAARRAASAGHRTARRRGGRQDRCDLRPSSGRSTALGRGERLAYRREHRLRWCAALEAWMRTERPEALAPCRGRQGHSTTCSSAGPPSPASSTTAGSASRTTPPNERCAVSPSAGRHGCSAAPIAAAVARATHVHADRHRQTQRHRPAGLARRRARAHRRTPHRQPGRTLPWHGPAKLKRSPPDSGALSIRRSRGTHRKVTLVAGQRSDIRCDDGAGAGMHKGYRTEVSVPDALHRGQADGGSPRFGLQSVRPPCQPLRSRAGRMLSCSSPGTPSSMNRACQRQTAVLLTPAVRIIAAVPSPSAVASAIRARQTCFWGCCGRLGGACDRSGLCGR